MASPARRHSRAPPPTPIATGKGLRSAAINDRVLTKYLQNSLKVPELHLPHPSTRPHSSRSHRTRTPTAIDLRALMSGDEATARNLVASCGYVGAVRVEGHGVGEEEVEDMVRVVGGRCFEVAEEEKKRWVGKLFGIPVGVREEFRWWFPARSEVEVALEALVPREFPAIRGKLEKLCIKLQEIAETISEALAKQLQYPSSSTENVVATNVSLLCLRKYDFHNLKLRVERHHTAEDEALVDYPSHALSLHLSLEAHDFCVQWGDSSTSFYVPRGSMVVTIGRQLQELCNGQLKGVRGEPMFEPRHDPTPSFSLEFMSSLHAPHRKLDLTTRTISLADQILFVSIVVAILCCCWSYFYAGRA